MMPDKSQQNCVLKSYTSLLEDIILYKMLFDVKKGYYIDIGCAHPVIDNVTKLFHDMGWKGINIDAQPELIAEYASVRPDDINLCLGVSDTCGSFPFYKFGWISTFDQEIVNNSLRDFELFKMECTTLNVILDEYVSPEQQINFLKIDVEHYEKQVLRGLDLTQWRPWTMAIEATIPCSEIPAWSGWEPLLFAHGYKFFLMHGVNRYYFAQEREDLILSNWRNSALVPFVPVSVKVLD